jgi:mono/diheme cytochrome c family protein
MTGSSDRGGKALALCFVGALFCAGASEEPRGREIYFRGTAAGKEITALLDGGQTRIVASMFPCAGCHGADGRGKTEGGIAAPDITWSAEGRWPFPPSVQRKQS